MIKRFRLRVAQLRQEPEEVRIRAATRWTIISGGLLAIVWLAILLPLQLRLSPLNGEGQEESASGTVSGAQDTTDPTTSPSPTPTAELYQGTRPSVREPAELTPFSSPTPNENIPVTSAEPTASPVASPTPTLAPTP